MHTQYHMELMVTMGAKFLDLNCLFKLELLATFDDSLVKSSKLQLPISLWISSYRCYTYLQGRQVFRTAAFEVNNNCLIWCC